MKRFAVSLFSLVTLFFAARAMGAEAPARIDGLIYYAPLTYHNSTVKKDAVLSGAYVSYAKGTDHSIELEYDHTNMKYITNVNYNQNDLALVYTKFLDDGSIRGGTHYIRSSTKTDNALVFFVGGTSRSPKGITRSANLFASTYNNYHPSLRVYQATLGDVRSLPKRETSTVTFTTKGNFILTSRKFPSNTKNFYSADETISYAIRNTVYSVNGWIGKQMFAVRNDGFAVFNTGETHKGGLGASVAFILSDDTKLTVFGGKEKLSDFGKNNRARATHVGVSVGHSF